MTKGLKGIWEPTSLRGLSQRLFSQLLHSQEAKPSVSLCRTTRSVAAHMKVTVI